MEFISDLKMKEINATFNTVITVLSCLVPIVCRI